MQFIRTSGWGEGIKALEQRLLQELQHKRVLWLVTGGSNIAASAQIMENIPDESTERLSIFLTDERFGEIGHTHSNAQQLLNAGFSAKQGVFVPVLEPGFTPEETRERYERAFKSAVEHADTVIAQIGIGPDGHVAGILPSSPAATTNEWVVVYEAPPYTRITLTFPALRAIDVAYALAYGEDKREALTLLGGEKPLVDQPAQILKALPEAYVYNDQVDSPGK